MRGMQKEMHKNHTHTDITPINTETNTQAQTHTHIRLCVLFQDAVSRGKEAKGNTR